MAKYSKCAKKRSDFKIGIGSYSEFDSGLYVHKISENECRIGLLASKMHDFEVETLEGLGCFLHQLNHEILHQITTKLEGWHTVYEFDSWRTLNPELSRKFYPLF